ncbi:hypothetical protein JOC34_000441 [Virgibacillus halotolerans]|uniref:FxLYD domain-containing protein n=1 Tax=Virgibacillus halotolerans TaxID=1071053 RepID=UPI00195F9F5D|nr:FxLYD domain-containing protein [Virgibacillus halotolerans]MBM7598084.1 hypothetical protein [Virgibacillus halotolerans]
MKKIYLLPFFAIIMLLVGCNSMSDDDYKEIVEKFSSKMDRDSTVSGVDVHSFLSYDEDQSTKDHYVYNVFNRTEDNLFDMTDDDQISVAMDLGKSLAVLTETGDITNKTDCGENNVKCSIGDIKISSSDGTIEYPFSDFLNEDSVEIKKTILDPAETAVMSGVAPSLDDSNSENDESDDGQLELQDKSCTHDKGYMKTKGFIKNNDSKPHKHIRVEVDYLDADGNVVDSDWTYAVDSQELKPDGRKSYEITTPDNDKITECNQVIVVE